MSGCWATGKDFAREKMQDVGGRSDVGAQNSLREGEEREEQGDVA